MDWVDRPQNYKGLYGVLQLLQGSHLDHFPSETLKLGWVASQSFDGSTMGYGIIFVTTGTGKPLRTITTLQNPRQKTI